MKNPTPEVLLEALEKDIVALEFGTSPANLYDPLRYMMQLGGKRLRPMLCLLAYQLFDNQWQNALVPAISIEVFHNFTLIHDDLMDNAPLRRNQATVHQKWNPNVAILSGDVMLVKVYDLLLEKVPHIHLKTVLQAFNLCAAQVCEGQQLDMDFETSEGISKGDYLKMIELKTAVLLGFALELGGILGGANSEEAHLLRKIGIEAGIGFQLQDDFLDVYGDPKTFGKQVGGDIIENKKTYLLLDALEKAKGETAKELQYWLQENQKPAEKVAAIRQIYDQLEVGKATKERYQAYFTQAVLGLERLPLSDTRKNPLRNLFHTLFMREK
ncbi:polyprenyl synthetase family protein [Hugenholtzia roseola]|uniref:polyprenyl synthetase family protein n=1 Tax=Hugenholtzia roseola TaxID=1002 RepID=UPI0003F9D434|nr:polyprenyl synthetase family protein [Hugenholtzia roseola]